MSYGTYNKVPFNRFAFNEDWSAALAFPITANASNTQAAQSITSAGAVSIVGTHAHTVGTQTLSAAGTTAVGAVATYTQAAQSFAGAGAVTVGAVADYTQGQSGLGAGAVDIAGNGNILPEDDVLLAEGDTMFKATVGFVQGEQTLTASASVLVGADLDDVQEEHLLAFAARLHLLPHVTGKTLNAHTYPRNLTPRSSTGSTTRH